MKISKIQRKRHSRILLSVNTRLLEGFRQIDLEAGDGLAAVEFAIAADALDLAVRGVQVRAAGLGFSEEAILSR